MKKTMIIAVMSCTLLLPSAAMAAPAPPLLPVQESAEPDGRELLLLEQEKAKQNGSVLYGQEPERPLPAPVAVERRNIDGTEYIIKVFETADDIAPEKLVDEDFEQDGFLFRHLTTDRQMNESADTKEVTEDAKAEGQSGKLEDVIRQFPSTKTYDKDGYKGTLTLDTGSIVTEVAGYTTKHYTVSTTKEYPGLMYADPSYVAQSATKDGCTLPLTDVSWTVMGTGLSGDSLVPTEYKAVATYAKTMSKQVPTGYVSTARYTGTVTKTTADTMVYTLTYAGRPLDSGLPLPLKIVSGIAGILLLGGGVFALVLFLRNRNGTDVYNLIDREYVHLGRQAVNPKEPVIDLNEFEDMMQGGEFRLILDKKTAKALFGRNINVVCKDVTVKHRVNERNGEYQFDLDFGGVLNVE